MEDRSNKRHAAIIRAVEFELANVLQSAGRDLTGIAVKLYPGECLLVLKAANGEGAEVCFVGAEDFGGTLIKAVRECRQDKLRWKADEYGGQS